jgi:hypothetical protein
MLSERTRGILGLIAEGRSYDQILQQRPELTYFDIFAAAREALDLDQAAPSDPLHAAKTPTEAPPPPGPTPVVIPIAENSQAPDLSRRLSADEPPADEPIPLPDVSPKRVSFIERARATHGRAFTRWSRDEDARLEALFRAGTPRSEIVRQLDRHEGAITRRLEKLGLIEPPEQPPARTRQGGRSSTPSPDETPRRDEPAPDRPSVPGWDLFRDRLSDEPPP